MSAGVSRNTKHMKIELAVKNHGHVPSFKNKKRIARIKNKPALITRPDIRKWMDDVIHDFVSQLFCASQIGGGETSTVALPPSLIVSSLPLDDSREWISELLITDADVNPGEEGAHIIITEIP